MQKYITRRNMSLFALLVFFAVESLCSNIDALGRPDIWCGTDVRLNAAGFGNAVEGKKEGGGQNARATVARAFCPVPWVIAMLVLLASPATHAYYDGTPSPRPAGAWLPVCPPSSPTKHLGKAARVAMLAFEEFPHDSDEIPDFRP